MKTIWYSVNEELERFPLEIKDQYCIYRKIEQKEISSKCAEAYFYDHPDTKFPITLNLFETENSNIIGSFLVDVEYEPVFYSYKIVDK